MKEYLIPQVRFPEFKEDWEVKRLDSVCSFYSGGTPTSTNREYYKGSIPFIGSGDISDKSVDKHITTEAFDNSSTKMVEIGDLLYALYGATSGQVGISKIYGAINQAVLCIKTVEHKEFLFQKLKYSKDKITSTYLQGGQGNLSAQIIKNLKLPFPTLPEQQKIAHFFSIVDQKLNQLQNKKNALELYKKGMMQQIFSQQLRFKDENGQDFPDWEVKKLGDLLIFKNGINASKESYGKGFKFINVLDIINNIYITYDHIVGSVDVSQEVFDKNIVEYGDILFQRSSETREEVGQSSVYLDLHKKATFGGFVIRGKKNGNYVPSFLNLLLKTSMARKSITSKSGGSTRYNVGQGILSSISLLFPCIQEQTKIANFLSKIDNKINAINQQIENTKTYKKGLLQKMFV